LQVEESHESLQRSLDRLPSHVFETIDRRNKANQKLRRLYFSNLFIYFLKKEKKKKSGPTNTTRHSNDKEGNINQWAKNYVSPLWYPPSISNQGMLPLCLSTLFPPSPLWEWCLVLLKTLHLKDKLNWHLVLWKLIDKFFSEKKKKKRKNSFQKMQGNKIK
jgi:hypothetical protein